MVVLEKKRKKKSAFEALILLIGVDKYKSHVFNPAATSHTFHLWKGWVLPGTAPGWGTCASGWFISSDGIGLFKLEQVGIVGAGLVHLCGSRKGTLKEWEGLLCSLGCEIQERLAWGLVGEMNCDELPSSVIMSCGVVKGSETCPANTSL